MLHAMLSGLFHNSHFPMCLRKSRTRFAEKNNLTLYKCSMIYIFIFGYARNCFLISFLSVYQCTLIFWKKYKWDTISLEPMGSFNH